MSRCALSWRRIAWLAALGLAGLIGALWLRWGEAIFSGQLGAMMC
jgi:hypothetical protein